MMMRLFDKVDRLVDIVIGRDANEITKSGQKRDVDKLDCPRHRHMKELFDIVRTFEEWKKYCGGFNTKFITRQTYEDLLWLAFGLAAVSTLYLKEDRSITIHQGRGGSDVCEHLFGMMKDGNANMNTQQAREASSKVVSTNTTVNNNMFRRKHGGANKVGAGVELEDYAASFKKKRKNSNQQINNHLHITL